jgi:PAP2 superfamily
MKHNSSTLFLAALMILGGPRAARPDVVVEWNAIAAAQLSGGNPLPHTREFSILHVAIYDAVVSITGDYRPYGFAVKANPHASAEAAAIAAAHDVLVSLHPTAAGILDAQYARSLDTIRDGRGKIEGICVGRQVAAAALAARSADGFNAPPPDIPDGTLPYQWRRTPPAFAPPLVPQFASVTPWVIKNTTQFLPKPPPKLESRRYARDFNEVKTVGSVNSNSPQDRKDLALFHLMSHALFWNDIARQLSADQPMTLSNSARIFAALNTAFMDSYIGAWHAKWNVYFNWRPVHAIRLADTDSNDKTEADPGWDSLAPAGPHPTYPSGHSVGSGASFYVLKRFFGNYGHSLTLTSPTAPGITLKYHSLRSVVEDVHDARVYLGVHFRFDLEAGHRQGLETAHFVLRNAFRSNASEDDETQDAEEWRP